MFPLPILSWQTKLIIVLGVFLIGVASGWRVHSWRVDAQAASQMKQDLDVQGELHDDSARIVKARDEAEVKERVVYRTIYRSIPNETDNRVCFTPDALSLWNDAIAGADTHRREPAGTTGENGPVGATDRDLLYNATENFERCNRNSRNHSALIDKVQSLKGKMCVCGE
jgi:hypothetical protein